MPSSSTYLAHLILLFSQVIIVEVLRYLLSVLYALNIVLWSETHRSHHKQKPTKTWIPGTPVCKPLYSLCQRQASAWCVLLLLAYPIIKSVFPDCSLAMLASIVRDPVGAGNQDVSICLVEKRANSVKPTMMPFLSPFAQRSSAVHI